MGQKKEHFTGSIDLEYGHLFDIIVLKEIGSLRFVYDP